MSARFHAPAAYAPGRALLPIELDTKWGPELVCTFWRIGEFFTAAWNRTKIVLSCHFAGGTDENNDEPRTSLSAE